MEFHQLIYTLKPAPSDTIQAMFPTMVTEWFPSQRAAAIRRLELFRAGQLNGPKHHHKITPVDVPTRRKEDLLAWLNRECV